jgi:hypothetical protein
VALRVLRLNGDAFLINGDRLVFGTEVDVETVRQPGGWLPIVYLDKYGRPVDLAEAKAQAIEAAPDQTEIVAAFDKVEAAQDGEISAAALEAMAAQFKVLAGLLESFDDLLAQEMRARAFEALRRAEDERDIELLLMAL